jgi:hypothetical protein
VAAQLAVRGVGDARSKLMKELVTKADSATGGEAVCIAFWLPSPNAARRRVSAADW